MPEIKVSVEKVGGDLWTAFDKVRVICHECGGCETRQTDIADPETIRVSGQNAGEGLRCDLVGLELEDKIPAAKIEPRIILLADKKLCGALTSAEEHELDVYMTTRTSQLG